MLRRRGTRGLGHDHGFAARQAQRISSEVEPQIGYHFDGGRNDVRAGAAGASSSSIASGRIIKAASRRARDEAAGDRKPEPVTNSDPSRRGSARDEIRLDR